MKQIEITVERDGTVQIDAKNFAGVGCEKATKAIEMALVGGDTDAVYKKRKPDFYNTASATNFNTSQR